MRWREWRGGGSPAGSTSLARSDDDGEPRICPAAAMPSCPVAARAITWCNSDLWPRRARSRSALSSGRPTARGRHAQMETMGRRSELDRAMAPILAATPRSTPPKARSSGSALGQSSSTAGRTTTSIPRGVPTTPRRRPSLSPPRTRPLFPVLRFAHPSTRPLRPSAGESG
jgi:hypothetical protein